VRFSPARAAIAVAATLLLLAPASASAQTEQRIAPGVRAGGVDLSGLLIEEAAAKLDASLAPSFARPISVHVAGRVFRLTAKDAKVRFDALRTAKRAYYAGRDTPPPPPDPAAGGVSPGLDVPVAVSHAKQAVHDFATSVARAVFLAPRDARVRITAQHVYRQRGVFGRYLNVSQLAAMVDAAIDTPGAAHKLLPKRSRISPKVNANDLANRYETILTVDRTSHILRLFKRLKYVKSYGIAVGQAGLETPAGLFHITNKQVNPAWYVPNSPWAGSLAGSVVPGGAPDNPLKARWLGIADGVGIHGTAEDWSIGSNASHGCIRMHVSDVIDLYPRVPVGTTVLIR
jgi:lipoprotein-anchoring transpeptidase ErfK/SrfK